MADTATSPAPAPAAIPVKKSKTATAKKTKTEPSHPKTSEMVNSAIRDLKERGGSSLQAIKKYITANYQADADKLARFIKKYLKDAVESGALVRTKGKGAAGSFKLKPSSKTTTKEESAPKKTGVKEGKIKKKTVKPKATTAKPKKAAAAPKKAASPKKAAAKTKSPSKAKKTAKPPTKKPKAPKPKKATPSKAKAVAKKPAKK